MSHDPKAIFDYIFGLTVPGVKLELSRVEQFMKLLGKPYKEYKVIHIAGTNGKGSTAAMLASILTAYGFKTGLFTSPHLIKPNERIRIGDLLVPDEFIIEKVESWKPHIDELGITFFELLTALGMVYFKEQQVEFAVIETGLGGRLDSTNVVDPLLSIITAISMDHENILGDTLEKIAMEKAGIIKSKRPLILARNEHNIQQLMEEVCRERESELTIVNDASRIISVEHESTYQKVSIAVAEKIIHAKLPLLGAHQVENFSNVLVSLDHLGLDLDAEKIQSGLDTMQWPGRMQVLSQNPMVLYDVAHNPGGLERLTESLRENQREDAILIGAFNVRKNISAMLQIMAAWSGPILFTIFEGYSALDAGSLIRQGVRPELIFHNPGEAYQRALELRTHENQSICYFGSHYLAESLFELFPTDK